MARGSLLEREVYLARLETFRASAAVAIRDEARRVLIVHPTYKPGWELPGGAVDPGETPRIAATREVAEELGLQLAVGRLLCVDHTSPTERTPLAMLHFIFDAPPLTEHIIEHIRLSNDELDDYCFADPDEAAALLGPRIGPRLHHALVGWKSGHSIYLEDGRP
ncbi:MAG: NUDIX hydrolase [Actinomycetota bacterium]|nr:NUDIX hydrolase [Actinomycetota bacterium]